MIKRGKETTSDNRETQKDREGLEKGGGEMSRKRETERDREREREREREGGGHCLGNPNPIQSLEGITKSL